jgi:hypothetical protein
MTSQTIINFLKHVLQIRFYWLVLCIIFSVVRIQNNYLLMSHTALEATLFLPAAVQFDTSVAKHQVNSILFCLHLPIFNIQQITSQFSKPGFMGRVRGGRDCYSNMALQIRFQVTVNSKPDSIIPASAVFYNAFTTSRSKATLYYHWQHKRTPNPQPFYKAYSASRATLWPIVYFPRRNYFNFSHAFTRKEGRYFKLKTLIYPTIWNDCVYSKQIFVCSLVGCIICF